MWGTAGGVPAPSAPPTCDSVSLAEGVIAGVGCRLGALAPRVFRLHGPIAGRLSEVEKLLWSSWVPQEGLGGRLGETEVQVTCILL